MPALAASLGNIAQASAAQQALATANEQALLLKKSHDDAQQILS